MNNSRIQSAVERKNIRTISAKPGRALKSEQISSVPTLSTAETTK
jgi:hypothetical protein